MGLLDRLLGRPKVDHAGSPGTNPPRFDAESNDWLEQAERFGDVRVDVVGESHYQPAIRRACGWTPGTDTRFECIAELEPEPTNSYDRNAIMVKIDGACVGYLSRADATRLGPSIHAVIDSKGVGTCRAMIAGRANGDTENLGVFLHLDAQIT